jgi:hypothetical protein
LRALGLNVFAGTCAVGLMLATSIPASSQPSHLSLGLVHLVLLQSRKSGIAAIVTPTFAITGPTIERITTPTTPTMVGPTIIGPTTNDPGWSRGFDANEQLLQCLFSQPFVSCG